MNRVGDPIIIALDKSGREGILRLADDLRGEVETVKIGLEAYTAVGPVIIEEMRERGFRVFVDLKLNDIPNTVQRAVRALVRRGARMLTVHTCGGREMLMAAAEGASDEAKALGVDPPVLLGVTVLTSLDDAAVAEIGWKNDTRETVLSLAGMALQCGIGGLVASAREAEALRKSYGSGPVIVTPGIRLGGDEADDQVRTATPMQALSAGADYLVVGRAVTADPDPVSALRRLRQTIQP
jgi:orotidine-5'-phosphate decarboxylase